MGKMLTIHKQHAPPSVPCTYVRSLAWQPALGISVLGRWRQEDPWGLLANEPFLISQEHCLQNQGATPDGALWPSHTSTHKCTNIPKHRHMPTHAHTRIYVNK